MQQNYMNTLFFHKTLIAARRRPAWAALLLLGLLILQWHGIAFWSVAAGAATGWAVSLGLELLALLLWARGRWWSAAALLVTLPLLAAPQYRLAQPILEGGRLAEAQAASLTHGRGGLAAEIATLEKSLFTFLDNSRDRLGWYTKIDETQITLAEKRAALSSLASALPFHRAGETAPPALPWQRRLLYAMQAAALLLLQWGNVLAIRALSGAAEPVQSDELVQTDSIRPKPHSEPNRPTEPPVQAESPPSKTITQSELVRSATINDLQIKRLQLLLKSKIESSGLSINKWCEKNRVHKRDLHFLYKHFSRIKEGLPTISAPKLADLDRRFLQSEEAKP